MRGESRRPTVADVRGRARITPASVARRSVLPAMRVGIAQALVRWVSAGSSCTRSSPGTQGDRRDGRAARQVLRQRPAALAQPCRTPSILARPARSGCRARRNPMPAVDRPARARCRDRGLSIACLVRWRRREAGPRRPAEVRHGVGHTSRIDEVPVLASRRASSRW